ncbi:MAG: HD family phosphohydrolase [Planctomycetaceae bacterium]
MFLFGTRRGRARGAALRVASASSVDLRRLVTDRSVLARLGLGLLTIAAIVLCVQGWRRTLPYRLGQRPGSGIAAIIDFERLNRERTERARERAAEQVPPVFRKDDRPLDRLPQELRAGLVALSQAGELGQVPVEARRAFGLTADATTPQTGGMPAADRLESFARLKQAAADEQALRDVVTSLARFIQPPEQQGLLRPENAPSELSAGGQIAVIDDGGELQKVEPSQVQLASLLAPGGALHGRWQLFPALLPVRGELEHWLKMQSPETLFFDNAATQEAREAARSAVKPERDEYKAGDLLVKPGDIIDEERLSLLQAEFDQLEANVTFPERVTRVAVVFLMLTILATLIGYHLVRHESKLLWNLRSLCLYLTLFVSAVGFGYLLSFDPWRATLAPVLAAVMVIAIVYNQVLATLTAFALSLIVIGATGSDLGRFTVMMSVCATAAILLPSVPSRSTLVIVGLWSAVVCFLMSWGTAVLDSDSQFPLWRDGAQWLQSLRGAGWCLAAGFLVSGSLPFIEAAFGAVTDISLLELGDVSHPLLQELVRRAPGTYNHSIAVASIGETAADAIGANGLLVRVGAYFHDIGKMLKPHYFVENAVPGENRHEHLAPAMSTLIIIGHVKDGADLARQHNLPQALIDFIEQHHGTTLVEYFYHEAARQAEEQPDQRSDPDEALFRYPGPRPQTREAAVLMIADAVEGASRALSEPTPSRIERLVHEIALKRLLDGQFDDCGLTMTELARIEESLTKSVSAMYHGRVKYPEQRSA